MSGDLVAELTLRLRNEMQAGWDEMRADLDAAQEQITALKADFEQLNAVMQELQGPAALAGELQAAAGAAGEVTTAVDGIGEAIGADSKLAGELSDGFHAAAGSVANVTTAVEAIGTAINADIKDVDTLKAEIASIHAPAMPGGMAPSFVPPENVSPDFIPPGTPRPADQEPGDGDDDEPLYRRRSGDKSDGDAGGLDIGKVLMAGLAFFSGFTAEKDYAHFQEVALQTAIIEGLQGRAARDEAQHIMHQSYNQAYLSHGNVDDIENAYFALIRQRLPRDLVNSMMGPLTEAATTYSTPVADITGPMFNLAEQFKIPGDQMAQGVAILGAASHMGHYYFSDFGQGLPQVSNQFAQLGDTGLGGEATAAAALEMVRRGTPDSGTAATDLSYLMQYMTSPIAARFFDRSKRSEDLLGHDIGDIFKKYGIKEMNLPAFLDSERDHGVDPLNAMVDYMHSIGASKMSPTDQGFVFNSLFHSVEASTAMRALLGNFDDFQVDQSQLRKTPAGFLDENFRTASQGDFSGVADAEIAATYVKRLYGQNTFGLLLGPSLPDTSQATLPTGSSAFAPAGGPTGSSVVNPINVPITLNVNVDKSGNVTAYHEPGSMPVPAGINLHVNQGSMLSPP